MREFEASSHAKGLLMSLFWQERLFELSQLFTRWRLSSVLHHFCLRAPLNCHMNRSAVALIKITYGVDSDVTPTTPKRINSIRSRLNSGVGSEFAFPGDWALNPEQNQVLTDLSSSSSSPECLISSVPSLCLIYDLWEGTRAARSGWDWCESPEWRPGQQALQITQKQHHSCLGATQAFLRVPTSAPSPQTGAHTGFESQVVILKL